MPKGVYPGNKLPKGPPSAEHRAKLSLAAKKRVWKPLSDEHKRKIGLAHFGRKNTEETKAKMQVSSYWKGRQPPIPFAKGNKLAIGSDHNKTHGLSKHPLYRLWWGIIYRCTHQCSISYKYYGGRGITIYEPWLNVATFLRDIESILGPRPEGKSLDRIDNDGPYHPGNVRWATLKEQARNRRGR